MPAQILCQGNLPHKGAICMPVPRVGFFASNAGFQGAKTHHTGKTRTFMALQFGATTLFGASLIACTITG
jgi:hypothetical protein